MKVAIQSIKPDEDRSIDDMWYSLKKVGINKN